MSEVLPDRYDTVFGLGPEQPDTDGDGVTDAYALMRLGSGMLQADTGPSSLERP